MSSDNLKVKTTWLLPKTLVKQIKQYALDNDTTSTAVIIEACNELLTKRKKKLI
jgi:hypothetical protein